MSLQEPITKPSSLDSIRGINKTKILIFSFVKGKIIKNNLGQNRTWMAITSGSMESMNLVNSGQLFLTRSRKLFAFQVKNFVGCFFWVSSTGVVVAVAVSSVSPLLAGDGEEVEESVGFLKDASFCSG